MSINRGPFNALVDDDGSNAVGTVWNKAAIAYSLLDPIDAALTAGILHQASGVNAATGAVTLDTIVMPALTVNDSVRVILTLTQVIAAGGQLYLSVPGIVALMRLDDLNGSSLGISTAGTWNLLVRPELTDPTGLRTLGHGGVVALGPSTAVAAGSRLAHAQMTGGSWQTGGWTLGIQSVSQAAGGNQVWAWTVQKV
jgi:hypothetical protein